MSKTHKHQSSVSSPEVKAFFAFTLLFPLLVLLLLEVVLRAIHYGPDLSLFATETIGGKTYHLMNPEVKSRYFSRVEFSPNTSPDRFLVPKPAKTFRIFVLGGSTTVGFPYGFAGSFSTFLRDRLHNLFPEKPVEVINLGMTATNSYTVADIAQELVAFEPDMICVYDGHNEFYGALGISSHESISASRWLTKVYLRLIHYRIFLLLRDGYRWVSEMFRDSKEGENTGTMMERLARGQYIRYGSPAYDSALKTFEENVAEVAARCRENNIPVLFCSQVSNVRDRAPFVSEDSPLLPPGKRIEFHTMLNSGISSLLNGEYPSALEHFRSAASLDSLRGDVHFRMAICLDSMGRKSEALQEYIRSRDFDMLRFRASSDFNNVLRHVDDGVSVFFVDTERKFRANSKDSLVGNSLFLEHLHPNSRGYFLIAKEISWVMHVHRLLASQEEWNERDALNDDTLWTRRPLTELDDLCAARRTEMLTSGWPFRPDDKALSPIPTADTLATIADRMVNRQLTWEEGHVAAARLYEQRADWKNVEKEYKALVNQIPVNVSAYLKLGQLYLRQERNQDAAAILFASTAVEQTLFANRALGILALEPRDAIPFLEKALSLCTDNQDMLEVGYLLAEAYSRDGKKERAVSQLHQVLAQSPGFVPAQRLLQQINPQ